MRRSPIKSIFLKLRNKLKSFNNSYSFCLIVQVWHKIAFYQWKRQWHPTPVLLSGKSHGQRSPSPWGREESDTTEWLPFHFHALGKEMATHSSVLAWRIPGTGEPGGLPSMGSHRVGHDWSNLAAATAAAAFYQKSFKSLQIKTLDDSVLFCSRI